MSAAEEMPDNPGDPDVTDPDVLSPDDAEAAAEEAAAARGAAGDRSAEEAEVAAPAADPVEAGGLDAEVERDIAGMEAESASAEDGAGDAEEGGDLAAELAERTEDLQRVSAEYANYRRRSERERANAVASARVAMAARLLPIVDDLRLAREHGDLEGGPLKVFAERFHSVLRELDVEAFGEEGDAFDPEIHEAVQDASTGDEKVVGTVLRQGYRTGERVVRTAMVIIADPA